jgi:hypothetical protein
MTGNAMPHSAGTGKTGRPAMRFAWKVTGAVALLGLLVVAGAAIYIASIDVNRYRSVIADAVRQATGRELTIAGDLGLRFGVPLAVSVNDVAFANAPWGSRPEMATLARASAEIRLLPLLRSQISLGRIEVEGVDLLLETDGRGNGNWHFVPHEMTEKPAVDAPASGSKAPLVPRFEGVSVEDARVTWRDGRTGKTTTVVLDRLGIAADSADAPMQVTLAAAVDGQPLSASGRLGPLPQLTQPTAPYPVTLHAAAPGMSFTADGTIRTPMKGQGLDLRIAVDIAKTAWLTAAGIPVPALPRLTANGRLTDAGGEFVVDDLKAGIGNSTIAGRVAADLDGGRPMITASLTSDRFDIADLQTGKAGDGRPGSGKAGEGRPGSGKSGGRLLPDVPLPFELLRALDAQVDATVDTLALRQGITARQVTLKATLHDGRLEAQPAAALFGGRFGGGISADAAKSLLALRLQATDLELGTMLRAFDVTDAIDGAPMQINLDVTGHGGTTGAVASTLDGAVRLVVGQGRLQNAPIRVIGGDVLTQLFDALNPLAQKQSLTTMTCAVLQGPLSRGRLVLSRGLAAETGTVNFIGSGTVELGSERLDLAIRTSAQQGLGVSVADIASSLIRIRGTLGQPSIAVDPKGAVAGAARSGLDALTGLFEGRRLSVQDLFRDDGPPCQVALGHVAAPATGGGVGQRIEDTAKSVGDKLKGLFGR